MPRKKARSGALINQGPTQVNQGPTQVLDYRHDARRKNIPPAGLAAQGRVRETPRMQFAYDPHLPPVLRFDSTGGSDRLSELLEIARSRPLSAEETQLLAEALRHREPWLEWTGKREKKGVEVEPVALHIHERVAAQAILKVAARENVQRDLFADPQLEYREAVQFYQHDVDWANRMILGDSLQVMASLARREDLAGKVQMIYMDPPYGIKFASNFQPEIGKRDVKDKESDLTREPEMVKAYRDTWTLGVHSYLAYLRDRLILCRELLADTGSVFVQISDENLHRVRSVMDEVFGVENFCSLISFRTTGGQASQLLGSVCDFLLWYAKDHKQVKYQQVFTEKAERGEVGRCRWLENTDTGLIREFADEDSTNLESLLKQHRLLVHDNITSQGVTADSSSPFVWSNTTFNLPKNSHWKTTTVGMVRLASANRLMAIGDTLRFKRYLEDFPVSPIDSVWEDTAISGFGRKKQYVVETNSKVIERCLLMTTHPGDLVLDPTCGSGTTAYVAEHWGRRWITIDTSRVALALARQRLLTATFPFYKVKSGGAFMNEGPQEALINQGATMHEGPTNHPGTTKPDSTLNPANGFVYKSVPHITLKSIAQNVALDAIFAKHQPILDEKLAALNTALTTMTPELCRKLAAKLLDKERREGKKAVTDADRRRWQLPKDSWKEWEVPFEADEDWTPELKAALTEYRMAWRAKMDEVNAAVAANADQEELVDHPEVAKGVVRVSGPFTVEAVMPAEESLDTESPIGDEPEELETFAGAGGALINQGPTTNEPLNAEAYLDKMLRLLQADGVRFPNNKVLKFTRLEPCGGEYLHAEGEWQTEDAQARTVAVSFGPQFGPVTSFQEESPEAFARRVLGDLYDRAPIMVLNDEAHHAYRPAPEDSGALINQGPTRLTATEKAEREEATVWIVGLDRMNQACGIKFCVDLSATPFYLQGSGYIKGAPFPWLVSDFGLVDAIESGIVKIPPLPVSDTTGRPEPKYFALWKHIPDHLQPGERRLGGKPKPAIVWREAQDALITLASQWKERFEYIQQASPGKERTPPVMIIVCDNTDIAELFYKKISGEQTMEVVEEEDEEQDSGALINQGPTRKKKAKTKTGYGTGEPFPDLFSNREGFRPTLRIDTKLLAEAESEDPNATRREAAEALREVVATVGKPGQPGEQVRCVVSVQMLTEGWDANNVTHILGLRAFSSQLLCEQVVGRGLRRMDYTVNPDGFLTEEYVDV